MSTKKERSFLQYILDSCEDSGHICDATDLYETFLSLDDKQDESIERGAPKLPSLLQ